jgi:chemotaxis protein methyltransferase CheR
MRAACGMAFARCTSTFSVGSVQMARTKHSSVLPPDPNRERAVDLALSLAEELFGVGSSGATPTWVRDRVRRYLEFVAKKDGVSIIDVASRLLEDRGAVEDIVGSLRVGETRFYRDKAQWEALEEHIDRLFPLDAQLSVLSAGCSTGEEAYTIGMLLTAARRRFKVLGVDRSASAIAVARDATYPRDAGTDIPSAWVERYCDEDKGRLRIGMLVRNSVEFEVCDLVKRVPQGPFHLIFFKNVLLYLTDPAGEQVATRLANELEEGGILIAAASEVLRLRSMGLVSQLMEHGVTALRRARKHGTPHRP